MENLQHCMNFAQLRRQAGYRSAKEFAILVDVSYSTYTRWERSTVEESGMPVLAAWKIADVLNCSIDEVVGRRVPEKPIKRNDVGALASSLSPLSKMLFKEYLSFLEFRDRIVGGDVSSELKLKNKCLACTHSIVTGKMRGTRQGENS